MSNEAGGQEKMAGTTLTTVPEYAQTALVLNDLKQRFAGRVFESLETDAQRKAARKDIAEVRDYRTGLEAERKRIKAPALERCRLIDAEAARLTTELRALEDPMKAQLDAKEAEIEADKIRKANAEAERVKGHMDAIQCMRDFPLSLQGKPSSVIESRIEDFTSVFVFSGCEEKFEEFQAQALDAYNAAYASAKELLQRQRDHEAEQEQIKRDREELAKQRAENERLQREAEERREADARREREAQEERDRAEREAREQVEAEERAKQKAIRDAEEAAQREAAAQRQRELDEAAERNSQEQARLDRERAEHEAKVEADRLANLGLLDAVKAVVDFYSVRENYPQCVVDLIHVYGNQHPGKDGHTDKREAAKPVRKPRAQV